MNENARKKIVAFLRNVPVFAPMTVEELGSIAEICRVRVFEPGAVIFEQGEPGEAAYILQRGNVEVRLAGDGETLLLARIGRHGVLGELSLIDPAERSATAVAVERTVAVEIGNERFTTLRDALDPAAYKLLRQLSMIVCSRIRDVNERIELVLNDQLADPSDAPTFPDPRTGRGRSDGADEDPWTDRFSDSQLDALRAGASEMSRKASDAVRRIVSKIWNAPDSE